MNNRAKVVVVILHWNNIDHTLRCLNSISKLRYENFSVLVVDNGSIHSIAEQINSFALDVSLLKLRENRGYAGGNNAGIQRALADGAEYVWLLNDDIVVALDTLLELMRVAIAHPEAGFLGPMVYMLGDSCRILSAGGIITQEWKGTLRGIGDLDKGQYRDVTEVDFISGCAVLVNRRLIESVGLLDERFFVYYEDVDWCYRASKSEFETIFVPQASVWHPDTRERDAVSPLVTYYMTRNQLFFLKKHHLGWWVLVQQLGQYVLHAANWSLNPKWRHKQQQRDAVLKALYDFARQRMGKVQDCL